MGDYLRNTNICQPMLKLKTHSGFHDLFLNYRNVTCNIQLIIYAYIYPSTRATNETKAIVT